MKYKNIPVKHHYIPQFILRNFLNNNGKIYYHNKNDDKILEDYTSNVFMEKNLNKDEINHKDNPMWIEEELSYFENEIAPIIRNFNFEDEIILSTKEIFKFRIFLFIMMFRSKYIRNEYLKLNSDQLEMYKLFQDFENSEDLWKKNLAALTQCKNEKDLKQFKDINPIILEKCLFQFTKYYTTIVEKRGNTNFIISDLYPVIYYRKIGEKLFPVCLLCPISPNRLLVLNYMENDKIFKNDSIITKNLSYPPQPYDYKTKSIKLVIKKIYESEVKLINKIIYESAVEGVVSIDGNF